MLGTLMEYTFGMVGRNSCSPELGEDHGKQVSILGREAPDSLQVSPHCHAL